MVLLDQMELEKLHYQNDSRDFKTRFWGNNYF